MLYSAWEYHLDTFKSFVYRICRPPPGLHTAWPTGWPWQLPLLSVRVLVIYIIMADGIYGGAVAIM